MGVSVQVEQDDLTAVNQEQPVVGIDVTAKGGSAGAFATKINRGEVVQRIEDEATAFGGNEEVTAIGRIRLVALGNVRAVPVAEVTFRNQEVFIFRSTTHSMRPLLGSSQWCWISSILWNLDFIDFIGTVVRRWMRYLAM